MAISDELTRIQTAKADIKASIEAKGVTVPSDALIDTYSDYVDEIQTGGGGGQAEQDLKNLIERDITSITIPNGTTTIGNSVFSQCFSLTSVNIPDSVTSIGISAFQRCNSLTSVTIGSGVTSISGNAFNQCTGLTSVTVQATTPPILISNAFNNTNNCPIYVPSESVETYKTTGSWTIYADRIQAIPSE